MASKIKNIKDVGFKKYTEYYSAIKEDTLEIFLGKWVYLLRPYS